MVGLIEVELASFLGIEYDVYRLGDGNRVAIIEENDFFKIRRATSDLLMDEEICSCQSTINGAYFILSKFWHNFDIVDSISDGEVKSLPIYNLVKGFDKNMEEYMRRVKSSYDEPEEVIEAEEYIVVEPDLFDRIHEKIRREESTLKITTPSGKKISITSNNADELLEPLRRLAESLGRNIIYSSHSLAFVHIKTMSLPKDAENEVLVLLTNNSHNEAFRRVMFDDKKLIMCLGRAVRKDMFTLVNGPDNRNEIKDFDGMFKDNATNIIYALKKKHIIYILVDIDFNIIIESISKRIYGKMPYDEMLQEDTRLLEESKTTGMENFINHSVQNASSVYDDLVSNYNLSREKYDKARKEAMEFGKLYTKYGDQIRYFNKDQMDKDQRKKATEEYSDALKIKYVSQIISSEDDINVYTDNIYAKDNRTGKWHDIGTFHIRLSMTSNNYDPSKTLSIMNTKHMFKGMRDDMQAPHVFPEGYLCHGNITDPIIKAYAKRDLVQVIHLVIMSLSNANTDDQAGQFINNWPEVSEEEAKGIVKKEEVEVESAEFIPVNI